MSKDKQLFNLLEEIEFRLNAINTSTNEEYSKECYEVAASSIEQAFRLLNA